MLCPHAAWKLSILFIVIMRFPFPVLLAIEVAFQRPAFEGCSSPCGRGSCVHTRAFASSVGFPVFADFLGFVSSKGVSYDACNDGGKKKMDVD